jgi:hypothetical protein
MDYHIIYNNIISFAKLRGTGDEKHHIVPKSLGGNNVGNLVYLTYREHYICHKLLVKMHPDGTLERKKMVYALWWMSKTRAGKTKITSHDYEVARKLFIEHMPTRQEGHKERFRRKLAAGEYNYDYTKISKSIKLYLSGLDKTAMSARMKKSALSCDQQARGNAISKGKSSRYKLVDGDNSITVWTYEDVKAITGYTNAQLRYRIQKCDGNLPDGRKVEYLERYIGNDPK